MAIVTNKPTRLTAQGRSMRAVKCEGGITIDDRMTGTSMSYRANQNHPDDILPGAVSWDFYFHHEVNAAARKRGVTKPSQLNADCFSVMLPADTDIADAVETAIYFGMPIGSNRSGCYQVQSDAGIWEQVDGNRMDFSTPRKAAKVEFKSWEQMEAEEAA